MYVPKIPQTLLTYNCAMQDAVPGQWGKAGFPDQVLFVNTLVFGCFLSIRIPLRRTDYSREEDVKREH